MAEEIALDREEIIPREIEEEMKQSYVDYAMSVIVGRALPDVRDGLKPVHRRILFAMNDMGMFHNKPFKKSARIVGEVLGKYHPHGDTAVYDSMVRMAQQWSLRYLLIDGQGNMGSIDGDAQAAMRYTEARLKKLSEELLQDIDKDTVEFTPNFDGSLKEPTVLPAKVPNLLINGSSGIAVGMATNIPPHNMGEVVDGTIGLIENPDIEISQLMQHIKGPDFPTGATICGRKGIESAFRTGRGKVIVRAKTELQPEKKRIVIKEIPYMVNKAELIKQIANLVNQGKIMGISDIRDESDREGMNIIIELRKDANSNIVINQLYKHTRMQDTFGIIMVALVNNEPKVMGIRQIIQHFISHRKEVVRKRTEFDLNKAKDRAHILEGLLTALQDIDKTVKLIKQSKSVQEARTTLQSDLSITEKQALAILEMKLQKLAALEQEKIKNEHSNLIKLIEELSSILSSEQRILDIIKKELIELKEQYGDERRTEIITEEAETFEMEDLIKEEKMVITVTHSGYIKRQPLNTYKKQKRGGKGIIAAGTKEQDFVEDIFIADTYSYILFFTNKGKIHWLRVYNVPEGSRQALGKSIVNLLQLEEDEKISAFIPVKEFKDKEFLIIATRNGTVKKTELMAYSNQRKGGIIAISLDQDDELIGAARTDGTKDIILATKNGAAVRFKETDVRPTGRSARGVRGATLKEGDEIIGMVVADDTKTLISITENGYGKRTSVSEYRLTRRGGLGVRNIICSDRNGKVVAVKSVEDDDDLMFISKSGITIRTPAKGISVIGRATQGMRLMKLGENDKVVAAAKISKDGPKESDNGDNKDATAQEMIEEAGEGQAGKTEEKNIGESEDEEEQESEKEEMEDETAQKLIEEAEKEPVKEPEAEKTEEIEDKAEEKNEEKTAQEMIEEAEKETEEKLEDKRTEEIEDKAEDLKELEDKEEQREEIGNKTAEKLIEEAEKEPMKELEQEKTEEIEDKAEDLKELEDKEEQREEIEDKSAQELIGEIDKDSLNLLEAEKIDEIEDKVERLEEIEDKAEPLKEVEDKEEQREEIEDKTAQEFVDRVNEKDNDSDRKKE
ncbi:DNA gyrase subunit A [Candidatus Woesearchaeota archaeon]|nr:DNA gyrase subunit A [Candidatus Woesearchaeota archaeon]